MIRVGHIVVAGEIGGAERMLVDLAKSEETEADHRVFVFSPSRALVTMFHNAGLAVTDRGKSRENPLAFAWRSLGPLDVRWLTKRLQDARIEVVHLHTLGSQMLGTRAAIAANLPVIRTEHSTRVYDDLSAWPFARWSLRRASAAICVSAHVREVAAKKAPWAKLRVIYNGVDTDLFAPREAPNDAHASESKDAPLRVLALGRLDPRKGFDTAIAAISRVNRGSARNGEDRVSLTIAGDGPDRDALHAFARELYVDTRVKFLGHVEDARTAIANADVVVCASRKEGLGIALLEAMAMGKTIVGFPTGGAAEFLDESVAFVTPRGVAEKSEKDRIEMLSSAIERAHGDREGCRERGICARARVVEKFSRVAMAKNYGDVYRSVSASSGHTPAK